MHSLPPSCSNLNRLRSLFRKKLCTFSEKVVHIFRESCAECSLSITHMMESDDSMLAATLQFSLPAYSASSVAGRDDVEETDKCILPQHVLQAIHHSFDLHGFTERNVPSPMIFRLHNLEVDKQTHCGVLEFGEHEAALLPNWIMQNLFLADGDEVHLQMKELPKATRIKLQPVRHAFTRIVNPKASMEYALRSFTALTEGDTIAIHIDNDFYELLVQEVQPKGISPPHAVCVVDAEVSVEFLQPAEDAPATEESIELHANVAVQRVSPPDTYKYFKYKVIEQKMDVVITVHALYGDPDIYVSTSTGTPSLSQHDLRAEQIGDDVLRVPEATRNGHRYIFIAIHSYRVQSKYTVSVTEIPPDSPDVGGQLIGTTSSADVFICDNCKRPISKKQFKMHSTMCARNNWYCKLCQKVLRKSAQTNHTHCDTCGEPLDRAALSKHVDLRHRPVTCSCGAKIVPLELQQHKEQQCPHRSLLCQFCDAPFPANKINEHSLYCGGKSTNCNICGFLVSHKRLNNHLASQHGINPSLYSSPSCSADMIKDSAADNELQRVIDESKRSAGIVSDADEDEQLRRALLESQRMAESSQHVQSLLNNAPLTTSVGSIEMGGDGDDAEYVYADDDSIMEDWDETELFSTPARHAEHTCPYCHHHFPSDEVMLVHMENECTAID